MDAKNSASVTGQAMRITQYDRAANEQSAISALEVKGDELHWFRLDDGVMGGQSETQHSVDSDTGVLHFTGLINTNGGGFASIRSRLTKEQRAYLLPETPLRQPVDSTTNDNDTSTTINAIRLRVRGDGKRYKFFLTDGSRAGPMARRPSWQMDIPTVKSDDSKAALCEEWQEIIIPLDRLQPSFAGSRSISDKSYRFDPSAMTEMGIMLSLKLADGSPNPVSTFGENTFPFSLHIHSIQPATFPSSSS